MVILGLFSTIVYQAFFPQVDKAKIQTARTQMDIVALALDSYRLDVGEYPAALDELVQSSSPRWKGPYIQKGKVPKDPWGNEYVYQVQDEGGTFELVLHRGRQEGNPLRRRGLTGRRAPVLRRGAGFTLIEIVLVLLVLAIAGVMAVPALQPALETVRAEAAARRTAAFLDDARRRAVLERRVLVVPCRPDEGRLVLRGARRRASGVSRCRTRWRSSPAGPRRVRYFPQGSSTGLTLLLRDRAAASAR